jgi:hypothetical protein
VIEDLARIQHDFGQGREFRAVHAPNPYSHQPSGHLVVWDFATGVTGNEETDFLAGELSRITFLADQIDGAHAWMGANGSVTSAC